VICERGRGNMTDGSFHRYIAGEAQVLNASSARLADEIELLYRLDAFFGRLMLRLKMFRKTENIFEL
jgi:hypothetical protein